MGISYSDQDHTVWPALLELWTVGWYFELLKACEMFCDFLLICFRVMAPWPVLRVDTFFGVMNLIIDEYVFIFSVEEDVYGFVGLSGDVVEVVAGGELVDVKRVPDGVVKHHY